MDVALGLAIADRVAAICGATAGRVANVAGGSLRREKRGAPAFRTPCVDPGTTGACADDVTVLGRIDTLVAQPDRRRSDSIEPAFPFLGEPAFRSDQPRTVAPSC